VDSTALVTYSVTEAEISKTREACASLTCETPAGYEAVRQAIGNLRTTRVAIEKRRVELKADALAFGRLVDTEAKRFTDLLFEIENPLKAKKAVIDDEADRVKREKEAAALKIVQDEIDRNNALKAAAEQAIKDAEEARMAAEREALRVERERLAAEQAKIDAARKAEEARAAAARKVEQDRMDAERAKLDAERRAVETERIKTERIEFERQAKIKAEKDAAEQLARDVIEKARLAAELAALAPDLEKVTAFVASIRAIQAPKLKSRRLTDMVTTAMCSLALAADAVASHAANTKGGT
jgi:chromosome segregation ATPase